MGRTLCKFGIHDWIYSGTRTVIEEPRGPYDPRGEDERGTCTSFETCTQCGKEREEVFDPYPCY